MPWDGFTSPNSQSYGGIQNQSYFGQGPGWWNTPWGQSQGTDAQAAFNARNYGAPRQATQPTPPVTPAAGPAAPSQPAFDPSSLISALTQSLPPGPSGLGTYNSGIAHGTLSNDAIAKGRQALSFTGGKAPSAPGVPVSSPAASGLSRQWNDLMAQGASGMAGDYNRDASYQQNQMGLAHEKALANAAMGGFKLMQNQYEDDISNQLARRGLGTSLLGSLLGYL
jgi:hypothetical protein